MNPYAIYALGNNAITIDFGNIIDEAINKRVIALSLHLQKKVLHGILDIIPAYSSLTVIYDLFVIRKQFQQSAFESIKSWIEVEMKEVDWKASSNVRSMMIPVCYDDSFAPDLRELSTEIDLAVDEIVQIHSSKTYRVYMIGFLPGFAYMGKVDNRIATPRKMEPVAVTAGSIGIAGMQTGIYPLDSPGGWKIIGKTPLQLFDPGGADPVLLSPGDEVRFVPISFKEFQKLN